VYRKPQKLAAEFFGTLAVVLVSAGVACADQFLRGSQAAGIVGPPASSAPAIGALGIALAYGFVFAVMSAAVGHISGGHFNPAVSVGFWATRRLSTFDALTYCIVQLGGSIVAAYLLRYAVPEATWRAVAMGTPDLASGITRSPGMLIEAIGAFVLTFAIFATRSAEPKSRRALPAIAGGLALAAGSLFAAPFTGGALNPARALGPATVANHWTNHGVYWIGPLAGGVLAAWICGLLFPSPDKDHDD